MSTEQAIKQKSSTKDPWDEVKSEWRRMPKTQLCVGIAHWLIISSLGIWGIEALASYLPDGWLVWCGAKLLDAAWMFTGAIKLTQVVYGTWTRPFLRSLGTWFGKWSRKRTLKQIEENIQWEFRQLKQKLAEATGSMPVYDALGVEVRRLIDEKLHGMISYRVAVERTLSSLREQKGSNYISEKLEGKLDTAIERLEKRRDECREMLDDLRGYVIEQTAHVVLSSSAVKVVSADMEKQQSQCSQLAVRIDTLIEQQPDLDLFTHEDEVLG